MSLNFIDSVVIQIKDIIELDIPARAVIKDGRVWKRD